jgi:hypothetical protein
VATIIRRNNPGCRFRIKAYSYVDQFSQAGDLMRGLDALVLLYQTDPTYGHWVVLTQCDSQEYKDYIFHRFHKRTNLPVYCFFDSYGMMVDKELTFVPDRLKGILGEEFPHLRALLKGCPNVVEWNDHHLQGETTNTCGRWSAMRAAGFAVPLEEWVFPFKGKNADRTITKMSGGALSHPHSMFGSSGGAMKYDPKKLAAWKAWKGPRDAAGKAEFLKLHGWTSLRKGKKSKKKLGYSGNVDIHLHFGRKPKPKGEKPFRMADNRLNYKDPFSAPQARYEPPKEVVRPTQQAISPNQVHVMDHNPNGTVTANLAIAGAVSQLVNSLPKINQGIRMHEATQIEDRKFIRQSDNIGGASDAVQAVDQMRGQIGELDNRQLRLESQLQAHRRALEGHETILLGMGPDVPSTVRAQLQASQNEMGGDASAAAEERPPLLDPQVIQRPNTGVSTTFDIGQPRPHGKTTVQPRFGGSPMLHPPIPVLSAFPNLDLHPTPREYATTPRHARDSSRQERFAQELAAEYVNNPQPMHLPRETLLRHAEEHLPNPDDTVGNGLKRRHRRGIRAH